MNDVLRWVSACAWLALAVYLTPCLWRSVRKQKARPLDPIWGTFWFLAVNRFAFNVRGLYAPNADIGLLLCHLFGLLGAGMTIAVVRSYRTSN